MLKIKPTDTVLVARLKVLLGVAIAIPFYPLAVIYFGIIAAAENTDVFDWKSIRECWNH